MSCYSEEYVTEAEAGLGVSADGHRTMDSLALVPEYAKSIGQIGDVTGADVNGGRGNGTAGFVLHFHDVLADVKEYAETLCPPDDWREDPCKDCDTYRAESNGAYPETDWRDFQWDKFDCCHCDSIEIVLRTPFQEDYETFRRVLTSSDWISGGAAWGVNQSTTYDCENKTWTGP
jgi:hypothetical protein